MIKIKTKSTWRDVADAARTTVRKDPGTGEPSAKWKKKILLAEHSPIRQLIYKWKWLSIKYWVSVHLVRHKIGIEHFVSTQRTDRTGENRDVKPQAETVNHECIANAQSIINISRKRLCSQASPETQKVWTKLLEEIHKHDPILYSVCVPECVYRGFCPELNCCGFVKTKKYNEWIDTYRKKK